MPRRIVDISVPLKAGIRSDPPWALPQTEHHDHRLTAPATLDIIREGHRAGREIGYCHIEKLHNLESLPPDGFMVSCFPVKVHEGSAGWTRAVAILDG